MVRVITKNKAGKFQLSVFLALPPLYFEVI